MTKTIIQWAMAVLLTAPLSLSGQVVVGGETPDPSAILDIQSTDKGFLWPRLSTTERNSLGSPAKGLLILNTNTLCIEINQGTPSAPRWERVKCRAGAIGGLDCGNASVSGPAITVPYTGGNGGVYDSHSVSSSGITGLSATLPAGNYADGAGSLLWTVSGVPSGLGTANFSLSSGGYTCSVPFTVVAGTISALDCSGATVTGALTSGLAASGVSASVPYTGGNGGFHSGQTVTSTGLTGLTATLSAGNFGSGAGNLTYIIAGTPASGGTASFVLNIGGQTCTLDICVNYVCRAKVNATDYRDFMCHNLGAANTCADPFTPSWEINGGYWQWGRSAEAAAGPTATNAKSGAVSGWNTTSAANGSWADGSKTASDPCPNRYRVPTKAQWDGVIANNTQTSVGSFSDSATNYGAGVKFGDQLMLPAAGYRVNGNGALDDRGLYGIYWSSTENGDSNAWILGFGNSDAGTYSYYRAFGLSVRCVAE
ncbi:MAG: fibrobacter succinogenes major paralogous domain-containing protein [Saprospiraceae bacterium]|nr:fibrobacter succinogenes major paralogous domain-containing protein [Saprospiraceae bacterium]